MLRQISNRGTRRGLADWWLFAALVSFTARLRRLGGVAFAQLSCQHECVCTGNDVSHRVIDRPIETIRGRRAACSRRKPRPATSRDERFGEDVMPALWRKMLLRGAKARWRHCSRRNRCAPGPGRRTRRTRQRPGRYRRTGVRHSRPGRSAGCRALPINRCRPWTASSSSDAPPPKPTDVLDASIDVLEKPIGCTANHPIWSETKQEFVRATNSIPANTFAHSKARPALFRLSLAINQNPSSISKSNATTCITSPMPAYSCITAD